MRVVAFANNEVGHHLVSYLAAVSKTELVGLVIHPEERSASRSEIIERSGLGDDAIIEAPDLETAEGVNWLENLKPDVGASIYFGYILQSEILTAFPDGVVNIHPAYLPFNRGAYPNVWAIVDRTPAGVTLHFLDEGIDTGPIIARRRVEVFPTDTGKSLYHRLEKASIELFESIWPALVQGKVEVIEQISEKGTYHRSSDVDKIDEIYLDDTMTARDLIDKLRARTFPPYDGCYFVEDGQKVFMRLQLWHEEGEPPE